MLHAASVLPDANSQHNHSGSTHLRCVSSNRQLLNSQHLHVALLQVRISGGTNIAYAITKAAQLLKEGAGEGGSRTLVLLTDGRVDGYQVGGGVRGVRGGAGGSVCTDWLQAGVYSSYQAYWLCRGM